MDQQNQTTLDIKVNARELSDLDREMGRTFKPGRGRELNREMTELQRAIMANVRASQQLTQEMTRQGAAGKVYQDLKRDLSEARREATALQQELAKIQQSVAGSAGGRGGGGGGAGGAAVVPVGYGGAGGARLTGGGQLPMPTGGALASALSSIPLVLQADTLPGS